MVISWPDEAKGSEGIHTRALQRLTHLCHAQALQPRQEGAQGGQTPEERAKAVLDDLLERIPELFDLEDIRSRIDELTPYIMVAIQVCCSPWQPGALHAGCWILGICCLSSHVDCDASLR